MTADSNPSVGFECPEARTARVVPGHGLPLLWSAIRQMSAGGPNRDLKTGTVCLKTDSGGVSELLRSVVPIERSVGLIVDWKVITGDLALFGVTKGIHNGLQGATVSLTDDARHQW